MEATVILFTVDINSIVGTVYNLEKNKRVA
jgi:hypothetical protein